LPRAARVIPTHADKEGYVTEIDAEVVGRLAMEIGAGRVKKEDSIDPAAGIVLVKKTGDKVAIGDPLGELRLTDSQPSETFAESLRAVFTIGREQPNQVPIVYEFIPED
jgi:thymidine phosphorylase